MVEPVPRVWPDNSRRHPYDKPDSDQIRVMKVPAAVYCPQLSILDVLELRTRHHVYKSIRPYGSEQQSLGFILYHCCVALLNASKAEIGARG